eukprot:2239846-Prymnesium_polylepis.1
MTSCIVRGNQALDVSAPTCSPAHTPNSTLRGVLWPHTPRSARTSRKADGETASLPPRPWHVNPKRTVSAYLISV